MPTALRLDAARPHGERSIIIAAIAMPKSARLLDVQESYRSACVQTPDAEANGR